VKAATCIAGLVLVGLIVGLYFQRQRAGSQLEAATSQSLQLSNRLAEAHTKLEVQEQNIARLQTNIILDLQRFAMASNRLTQANAALAVAQAERRSAVEQAKQHETALARAESVRAELIREKSELSAAITSLQEQLADMQNKLSAAESERAFFADQMRREQGEKDELARRFNDPAALRAQAARVKEMSRRSTKVDATEMLQLQPDGNVRLVPNFTNVPPNL
jgi:chromosome segregation ATPase